MYCGSYHLMFIFRTCCAICRWFFLPPWFVVLLTLNWFIPYDFYSFLVVKCFWSSHYVDEYLYNLFTGYYNLASFEFMGRHFCSNFHHSRSTWDYLTMSSHCCIFFKPILYIFAAQADNSLSSSCLIVFSGNQIFNGFRLLHLAFTLFITLIQMVPSGYISDWSWSCMDFNLKYGPDQDRNVPITNT